MSKLRTHICNAILVATVLVLSASSSQAEVFTTLQFIGVRVSNQAIAVPTTFYLMPRYRSLESRRSPETFRLRGPNGISLHRTKLGIVLWRYSERDVPSQTDPLSPFGRDRLQSTKLTEKKTESDSLTAARLQSPLGANWG